MKIVLFTMKPLFFNDFAVYNKSNRSQTGQFIVYNRSTGLFKEMKQYIPADGQLASIHTVS